MYTTSNQGDWSTDYGTKLLFEMESAIEGGGANYALKRGSILYEMRGICILSVYFCRKQRVECHKNL